MVIAHAMPRYVAAPRRMRQPINLCAEYLQNTRAATIGTAHPASSLNSNNQTDLTSPGGMSDTTMETIVTTIPMPALHLRPYFQDAPNT
jgi:hypothetical protein